MRKIASTLVVSFMISQSAMAGLLYNYGALSTKDLDQMAKIVQTKIQESKSAGGDSSIPLKEALQAVYSRPNEDFVIEKVQQPLRTALDEEDKYEEVMGALVTEAIGAVKNPRAFKPVVQVTYVVFLENVISEFQPRLNQDFERKTVERIRDAKLEVSKEARGERLVRVMKENKSPSEIAKNVLERYDEEQKEKAKAEKKSGITTTTVPEGE